MESFKLSIDWGKTLLTDQNNDETRSFCDLKLICSDGYILIHNAILPDLFRSQQNTSPAESASQDSSSTTIELLRWTLLQVSKLVLILYTGETIISSKTDYTTLKPLLSSFMMLHLKLLPLPRILSLSKSKSKGQNTDTSSRERWLTYKVRGVKFVGGLTENSESVFIYGDGSIVAVPESTDMDNLRTDCNVLTYDENGKVVSQNEQGFFCSPCCMIFCESSEYLQHSIECTRQHALPSTPRAIKMEPNYIKLETLTTEQEPDNTPESAPSVSINVCLICVTSCKDTSELIIHSNERHKISPAKDYDLGAWKCRRCNSNGRSSELSVFIQHVYHCKRDKRKRSVSRVREQPSGQDIDDTSTIKRIRSSNKILEEDSKTNELTMVGDVLSGSKNAEEEINSNVQSEKSNENTNEIDEFNPMIVVHEPSLKSHLENTHSVQNKAIKKAQLDNFRIPKLGPSLALHSKSNEPTPSLTFLNDQIFTSDSNGGVGETDKLHVILNASCLPVLDAKETSIRSPKALAVLNYNKGNASREKSEEISSGKPKNSKQVPEIKVEELSHQQISQKQSKASSNDIVPGKEIVTMVSGEEADNTRSTKSPNSSTRQRLKLKRAKLSNWICRKCQNNFTSQKLYMLHECQDQLTALMPNIQK